MEKTSNIIEERKKKAAQLKEIGVNLYPAGYHCDMTIKEARQRFEDRSTDSPDPEGAFSMAGRMMSRRDFGKASFINISDSTDHIQAYIRKDRIGEEKFKIFKLMDIGDHIGLKGSFFLTKTGEFTILAEDIALLTKSIRPLPEKWHGLTDIELRYRQRYLDLIMNEESREVFILRSRIIQLIREFFIQKDFLEVETPMMQPIPGGATAKPFKTYHNALGMDLYLRVAPELYLKRLVVGGLEKIFEINRNFRNEGISIQHNPEFTMLEFYMAYATYEDLMELTEELFKAVLTGLGKNLIIDYQGNKIDMNSPWRRISLLDSLREIGRIEEKILTDFDSAKNFCQSNDINIDKKDGLGKLLSKIFDEFVEPKLIQPTFVTGYPREISPLSRSNDDNPDTTDRFELFIIGKEIANGFNELNDPEDQRERFARQVSLRESGDDEALFMDEDYIIALEHGLPPTAGEGIGIDRVIMLLTDSPSIRDVIYFPHMRAK
jgi:lysyl-tRNA synthetase class 2